MVQSVFDSNGLNSFSTGCVFLQGVRTAQARPNGIRTAFGRLCKRGLSWSFCFPFAKASEFILSVRTVFERYSDGSANGMSLISLFPVRRSVRMCLVRPNGIRTAFGRPCKRVVFDHSASRSQERSIPGCASGRPPCVRPDGLYCFALPCLQRLYICIFLKGKMTYVFERLRSDFEKQFSACSPSKYRSKPCFEIAQTKFKQL